MPSDQSTLQYAQHTSRKQFERGESKTQAAALSRAVPKRKRCMNGSRKEVKPYTARVSLPLRVLSGVLRRP